MEFTEAVLAASLKSANPQIRAIAEAYCRDPLQRFRPRPNNPNDHDEQTAFIEDNISRFAVCLGGTGSGKTEAAAYKVARYVLDHEPQRERLPFWIVGDTYDTTCDVCWNEKLSKYIPKAMIHSIDWYKSRRNWPYAVSLKHPKKPGEIGWVLEFKSYEQGLAPMKAKSIGGFWCNEEVPYETVLEVMGRCRDYNSPGWADFTPIEVKSPEWIDLYENPPEGWRFYHLNTRLNTALGEGWADWYLGQIPEDMRGTREIGVFSVLRGQVFKEFRKSIHVIEPFRIPRDWRKVRGVDFGFNNPFCCLWVARDHDDRYYVYDEHYESRQLNAHHASAIHSRDWNDELPWYGPTYTDHDAQERAELGNFGIQCTPASKAINPGIELLRSLMMVQPDGKPRLFIFDKCVNLIREIVGYKWREGTGARNAIDEPVDKDNHCLAAGTMVLTSEGEKPIEAIVAGESVLTRQGYKPVTFAGPTRIDYTLVIGMSNGRELEGTADHNVAVGDDWVRMDDLAGNELTPPLGFAPVRMTSIRSGGWQQKKQTYDLSVADCHEFFANGVLVSNSTDALRYAIYSDRVRSSDAVPTSRRILGEHTRHGVLLSRRN